jgi:hypothetical protein
VCVRERILVRWMSIVRPSSTDGSSSIEHLFFGYVCVRERIPVRWISIVRPSSTDGSSSIEHLFFRYFTKNPILIIFNCRIRSKSSNLGHPNSYKTNPTPIDQCIIFSLCFPFSLSISLSFLSLFSSDLLFFFCGFLWVAT